MLEFLHIHHCMARILGLRKFEEPSNQTNKKKKKPPKLQLSWSLLNIDSILNPNLSPSQLELGNRSHFLTLNIFSAIIYDFIIDTTNVNILISLTRSFLILCSSMTQHAELFTTLPTFSDVQKRIVFVPIKHEFESSMYNFTCLHAIRSFLIIINILNFYNFMDLDFGALVHELDLDPYM